jgi:hypothetical protein
LTNRHRYLWTSGVRLIIRDMDAQEDHALTLSEPVIPVPEESIRFEVAPGEWRSGRVEHRSFQYAADGLTVVLEVYALEDDEDPG